MSADAKAWEHDGWWSAIHDGDCTDGASGATHTRVQSLSECLDAVERCDGYRFAWSIREHTNGLGLIGYISGGTAIVKEK